MSYGTARPDTATALTDALPDYATLVLEHPTRTLPYRLDVVIEGALDEQFDFDIDHERIGQVVPLSDVVRAVMAHVLGQAPHTEHVQVDVYDTRPYPPEPLEGLTYDPEEGFEYEGDLEDVAYAEDEDEPATVMVVIQLTSDALTGEFAGDEIRRLLTLAGQRAAEGVTGSTLLDVNGNAVGTLTID